MAVIVEVAVCVVVAMLAVPYSLHSQFHGHSSLTLLAYLGYLAFVALVALATIWH